MIHELEQIQQQLEIQKLLKRFSTSTIHCNKRAMSNYDEEKVITIKLQSKSCVISDMLLFDYKMGNATGC